MDKRGQDYQNEAIARMKCGMLHLALQDYKLLPQEGIFGHQFWLRFGQAQDSLDDTFRRSWLCPKDEELLDAFSDLANPADYGGGKAVHLYWLSQLFNHPAGEVYPGS